MKATYVSVWDGGVEVRTNCEYNLETGEVTDIETSDVSGVNCCEDEYIELPDGKVIRDFHVEGNKDESLSEDEILDLVNKFRGLKK
jgi:hypothetical protein